MRGGKTGLGITYDLAACLVPYDASGGAGTGDVINLRNAGGVDVILIADAGAGSDIPILTFYQIKLIGGTPKALLVDHYYQKEDTVLTTGSAWTKVANGTAGTGITTITGDATSDDKQIIWVIPIEASMLDSSGGYDCVQVSLAQTAGAGVKLTAVLYMLRDLKRPASPALLPDPLI